jgi:hypothetical protein
MSCIYLVKTLLSDVTKNYYAFPPIKKAYADALQFASVTSYAGVKGHLFVPNSKLEFDYILGGLMYPVHKDSVWMGVSDAQTEGIWLASSGPNVAVDFTDLLAWYSPQPNGGTAANCVIHSPGVDYLNDVACSESYKLVIEFECSFGQRFNDQGSACIGKSSCNDDSFHRKTYQVLGFDRLYVRLQQCIRGRWLASGTLQSLGGLTELV